MRYISRCANATYKSLGISRIMYERTQRSNSICSKTSNFVHKTVKQKNPSLFIAMSLFFRSLPTIGLRSKPSPLTSLPFFFLNNFHNHPIIITPTSLISSRTLSSAFATGPLTSVETLTPSTKNSLSPTTTDTLQWVSRTQYCGELSENDVGKRVRLCGWVALHRIHGGLTFVNLRDQTGIVQVNPLTSPPVIFQCKLTLIEPNGFRWFILESKLVFYWGLVDYCYPHCYIRETPHVIRSSIYVLW